MSDEASNPKKNRVKVVILVAAALAVAGGGFGAWQVLKKRDTAKTEAGKAKASDAQPRTEPVAEPAARGGDDSEDCGEAGEKKEGGHGGFEAAPVMVLTRTVNLTGPRRNAFLRCELNILFCDADLGKLASGDKPSAEKSLIQSIVLDALSGKSVEEASDPESRESLRKEIKDKLNEQFLHRSPKAGEKEKPKRPIKNVLIVDWAIQQ